MRREPLQERDLRSIQVSPSVACSLLNKATTRFTLLGSSASVKACVSLACRKGEGPLRVKTGGRDGAIRFPVYPRQPTCRQSAPTSVQGRFCCKSLFEVTNENFQGR